MNTESIPMARPALDSVLSKAHLIVALVTALMVGLTITVAGLFALRFYSEQNLRLIARSMSYTVEAAVVFGDAAAAGEAIALIGRNEDIDEVLLTGRNDQPLAHWTRHAGGTVPLLEQMLAGWILPPALDYPIIREQARIGRIHLVPRGSGPLRFITTGLLCVLLSLVISTVIALRLARRMQHRISGPLHELARIAHGVRRERSFALRAGPAAIAEIHDLNEDFNALLDELEAWQTHVQQEHASLSYQASHDSLTGLCNRAFLEEQLERAVQLARLTGNLAAVYFIDSDRFKQINDTYGHAAGDHVLVTIATRIKSQLREDDLVARLGGDEFAVLLRQLRQRDDALQIAAKILAEMRLPIVLPGGEVIATSLSIGIAIFPEHGSTAQTVLAVADEAMYRAKNTQRGSYQLALQDQMNKENQS